MPNYIWKPLAVEIKAKSDEELKKDWVALCERNFKAMLSDYKAMRKMRSSLCLK